MNILESNRIQGIEQYYFAQKLAQIRAMDADGGEQVLNLGIGSPDLLPHQNVIDALQSSAEMGDANKYQSYSGLPELRKAFSDWYKFNFNVFVDPEKEILPLLGSKEGVMHISMAFINAGDEVLVPNPGYPAYETCTKIAGGKVRHFNLEPSLGWKPDLEKLRKEDLSNVKLMWVNYPNMPTGAVVDKAFFHELAEFGKQHEILICHDNPYTFILNDKPLSILQAIDAFPWVLELTSLSKNYNMAGWRIGAVTAHKDIIQSILKFKSNMDSGMYKPLQLAAVQALKLPVEWHNSINQTYTKRKTIAIELFQLLGCTIEASVAGMFVWAKIPNNKEGADMSDFILDNARVFITPGFIFGDVGKDYLRISLCSPESVFEEAIKRVRKIKSIES